MFNRVLKSKSPQKSITLYFAVLILQWTSELLFYDLETHSNRSFNSGEELDQK